MSMSNSFFAAPAKTQEPEQVAPQAPEKGVDFAAIERAKKGDFANGSKAALTGLALDTQTDGVHEKAPQRAPARPLSLDFINSANRSNKEQGKDMAPVQSGS